jgi:hypothetical protein
MIQINAVAGDGDALRPLIVFPGPSVSVNARPHLLRMSGARKSVVAVTGEATRPPERRAELDEVRDAETARAIAQSLYMRRIALAGCCWRQGRGSRAATAGSGATTPPTCSYGTKRFPTADETTRAPKRWASCPDARQPVQCAAAISWRSKASSARQSPE